MALDIGPASDMFSLGAVLTFAATGQGPFGTGSNAALMYRLVNSPADLGSVPGELRSLVGSCLAKHPSDRPTARELLAEVGAIQPAPGWLAESIMSSFAQDRLAAAPLSPAGADNLIALTGASGQPPPASPGRPGRHRISRPLASAGLTGALMAASALAAFALIGADRTPAASHGQPQVGAGAVATAPAVASNPPASSRASSSAAPSAAPSISPSVFLSPALSRFFSTSVPPTPVSSSPTQPTKSSNPGNPPASSPPASSPPASSPPASSPPASSPPASSPPASSPPASSPPASSPPASSPPASSAPASSAAASTSQSAAST